VTTGPLRPSPVLLSLWVAWLSLHPGPGPPGEPGGFNAPPRPGHCCRRRRGGRKPRRANRMRRKGGPCRENLRHHHRSCQPDHDGSDRMDSGRQRLGIGQHRRGLGVPPATSLVRGTPTEYSYHFTVAEQRLPRRGRPPATRHCARRLSQRLPCPPARQAHLPRHTTWLTGRPTEPCHQRDQNVVSTVVRRLDPARCPSCSSPAASSLVSCHFFATEVALSLHIKSHNIYRRSLHVHREVII